MIDVRVESATTDDLDALVDLWVSLVADQRGHGTHLLAEANRETARDFLGQSVIADTVAVARREDAGRDGEILGFVMYHVETGLYEQDATRGVVDNVFVRSESRDQGVGGTLLEYAEVALADEGCDVVALSVMADNEAARRLYRDRGYRPHRVTLEKSTESDIHSREDR